MLGRRINCCKIKIKSYGEGSFEVDFECDALCRGDCSYRGEWSNYAGGTCSYGILHDDGKYCNNAKAKFSAMKKRAVEIKAKIDNLLMECEKAAKDAGEETAGEAAAE